MKMLYNCLVGVGRTPLPTIAESAFSAYDAEGRPKMRKNKIKYSSDLPRRMYSFFHSYCESGAPSFSKFARSIGATLEDLTKFRKKEEFERAWRECNEIRRDYLIDNALTKRHDPSFSKFLLSMEYGEGGNASEDGEMTLRLEVRE